jgi:hypothetical protein
MKKTFAILGAAAALTLGGTAVSATPAAPIISKAQAVTRDNCGMHMDGRYWCYQHNCTFWDVWWWGCNDGWVISNTWYAGNLETLKKQAIS